jgi:hydroxypyruvate isomerase
MKRVALNDYSACIEMLFAPEADDFVDRIQLAADAGFPIIEFWGTADKDVAAIASAAKRAGVKVGGILAEPGNANLADPARHQGFLAGVEKSKQAALELGARLMIVTAGNRLPGVAEEAQSRAVAECLGRAADIVKGSGIVLALEPINTGERPDYFLWSTRAALDVVDAVNRPEVKLLYDLYHSAVMGETLTEVLAGRVDRLAHVHLSDHPGRHEPGTGGIRWRDGVSWLRANGYAGKLGLEYRPARGTVEGLRFLD